MSIDNGYVPALEGEHELEMVIQKGVLMSRLIDSGVNTIQLLSFCEPYIMGIQLDITPNNMHIITKAIEEARVLVGLENR